MHFPKLLVFVGLFAACGPASVPVSFVPDAAVAQDAAPEDAAPEDVAPEDVAIAQDVAAEDVEGDNGLEDAAPDASPGEDMAPEIAPEVAVVDTGPDVTADPEVAADPDVAAPVDAAVVAVPDPCALALPCTSCDDGNPCTKDVCHPSLGCLNTADSDVPGCPCPWWSRSMPAKVLGASVLADGRTVALLATEPTPTVAILDAQGNDVSATTVKGAVAVVALGQGWVVAQATTLTAYDASGAAIWKKKLPTSGGDIQDTYCYGHKFWAERLLILDGDLVVIGEVDVDYYHPEWLSCWDGGAISSMAAARFDANGKVVKFPIWQETCGGQGWSPIVSVKDAVATGSNLYLAVEIGCASEITMDQAFGKAVPDAPGYESFKPNSMAAACGKIWQVGGKYYGYGSYGSFSIARFDVASGKHDLKATLKSDSSQVRLIATRANGGALVFQHPYVGYSGPSEWYVLPADSTTTQLIDMPADLTPTAMTLLPDGGYLARGSLGGKPWLAHTPLVPGKPLGCKP